MPWKLGHNESKTVNAQINLQLQSHQAISTSKHSKHILQYHMTP